MMRLIIKTSSVTPDFLLGANVLKSSHLTKFDAFRINRDQVIDLKSCFQIYANVSTLQNLYDFYDTLKNGQTDGIFISACHKTDKNFKGTLSQH